MKAVNRIDCTSKYREYTGDIHVDCKQFSDHHPRFVEILVNRIDLLPIFATSIERANIRDAFLDYQFINMKRKFYHWFEGEYSSVEDFWRQMVAEYRLAPDDEDIVKVMQI